jgi:hypothetical protein
MRAPLRCDHCGAELATRSVERNCKRFCCSECLLAFFRGEFMAISPHVHDLTSPDPLHRVKEQSEVLGA